MNTVETSDFPFFFESVQNAIKLLLFLVTGITKRYLI